MEAGLDFAMRLAAEYHGNQRDKAGEPYIAHICAVVAGVRTADEKTVAALHDIIEDGPEQVSAIIQLNFPQHISDAVFAITKRKGEGYSEYLERIKQNALARIVKIADLRHNMDLSRLPEVTDKDHARQEKYKAALEFLMGAE